MFGYFELLGGTTTFSIKGLHVTLSITPLWHYTKCHYGECYCAECHYAECYYSVCHYAECPVLFIIILNVIMLSVIMLNVVAPFHKLVDHFFVSTFVVLWTHILYSTRRMGWQCYIVWGVWLGIKTNLPSACTIDKDVSIRSTYYLMSVESWDLYYKTFYGRNLLFSCNQFSEFISIFIIF
jgi:hypothetical protein